MHIGQNIMMLRQILGIKQQALARTLRISQQAVSKMEMQADIECTLLNKIADAFGVPVDVIKDFDKREIADLINNNTFSDSTGIGKKIEGVRRFVGTTQAELGEELGISKQAVSKMEKSNKMNNEKIKQVATVLGVTPTGLKNFNREAVQYALHKSIMEKTKFGNHETSNIARLEKAIKFFQYLLKKEREK